MTTREITPEKAKEVIKNWWMKLFREKNLIYHRTFDTEMGKEVLNDLAIFCHANDSTYRATERETMIQEGKRQVWLRIQNFLQLSDRQLWQIKKGEIDARIND